MKILNKLGHICVLIIYFPLSNKNVQFFIGEIMAFNEVKLENNNKHT